MPLEQIRDPSVVFPVFDLHVNDLLKKVDVFKKTSAETDQKIKILQGRSLQTDQKIKVLQERSADMDQKIKYLKENDAKTTQRLEAFKAKSEETSRKISKFDEMLNMLNKERNERNKAKITVFHRLIDSIKNALIRMKCFLFKTAHQPVPQQP